jgi:hypothetical protein
MEKKAYTEDLQGLVDEFHQVRAKLHEIYLAEAMRKGRFFAKTVNERTLEDRDICMLLLERGGYEGNVDDMMHFLKYYHHEVGYQLCDGNAVNMGGYFALYPHIKGVFNSPQTGRYDMKHPLTFHFRILRKLYDLAEHIAVFIDGIAESGAAIYEFVDAESGLVNQKVTPGGQFSILGKQVKLAGDAEDRDRARERPVGVTFFSPGEPSIRVGVTKALAVNEPHRLIGINPDLLPGRPWYVEVTTRYSKSSTLLKEARTLTGDFALLV